MTDINPNVNDKADTTLGKPADIFERNIPDWLSHQSFILWKLANKDGRQTKLPLTFKNDRLQLADVTNQDDWLDFVDACDAFNRFADKVNGLGIVLHADNISAVDLDHCLSTDGKPNPFATNMLKRLDGAYVEISSMISITSITSPIAKTSSLKSIPISVSSP